MPHPSSPFSDDVEATGTATVVKGSKKPRGEEIVQWLHVLTEYVLLEESDPAGEAKALSRQAILRALVSRCL